MGRLAAIIITFVLTGPWFVQLVAAGGIFYLGYTPIRVTRPGSPNARR